MKQTLKDVELSGQRLLTRVDFNVPMDDRGRITDDTRIRESLPTIRYALEHDAIVILMSHLGRPKGQRVASMSLAPLAAVLGEHLGRPVHFVPACVGPEAESAVDALKPGDVILLENLRFHPEEEQNDAAFAASLATLGQIYVNDAFGSAHRAHASTEGVAHHLPAVAGLLMEKEIAYLGAALHEPARPFVAILGGAKVSDKIGVLTRLLEKVDRVLIGGGMAYTFLKAQGHPVGTSKLEADKVGVAAAIMQQAEQRTVRIVLPSDHVITTSLEPGSRVKTTDEIAIPDGWLGADIGCKTRLAFRTALTDAKQVIWNGPMGVFEQPRFAAGSQDIADALANLDGTTIIGGGDTAACVAQAHLSSKMSHISTGGGASLEFLEGKSLPGIAILNDCPQVKSS